ncbi:hypothetical protein OIE62_29625 [Streptomyces scopuliridis]|uniref:Uncharacterized protein n=1 Tax=Streptomyces scopuliridis TaxID=452529 RepID=A0ACD4ZGN9_9ACTN|nr:hypothetical protein [Streptomyces scopuliridis]WSB97544.1 hypothetical protein OG835_11310 [Streptomyces scopuliridis]WSC08753.1 hypothetical protein OIE62_29625 [Streptomyces scopuliridis]
MGGGGGSAPSAPSALKAGAPLENPEELVSHDGVLRAELNVSGRLVNVAGRKLRALTYNDRFMPPALAHPAGGPAGRTELETLAYSTGA